MKDKICTILFIIGFIIGVGCTAAAVIFAIQNPDMAEMRRLMEFPQPSMILFIDVIILSIVRWWWDN